MNTSHTSLHLDGTETVRLYEGNDEAANHVSVNIQPPEFSSGSTFALVLPHRNGHEVNAAFLRATATALLNLARECDRKASVEALRRKLTDEVPA